MKSNRYLENSEKGLGEVIESASFSHSFIKVKLSPKKLHAKQGKDNDKEEKQQQQGCDGLHGVEERGHQVTERCPVTEEETNNKGLCLVNTLNLASWYQTCCSQLICSQMPESFGLFEISVISLMWKIYSEIFHVFSCNRSLLAIIGEKALPYFLSFIQVIHFIQNKRLFFCHWEIKCCLR